MPPDGAIPGGPTFASSTATATPVSVPGGPTFDGYPQPPDVPCDPIGEDWRGPPGPPGPPGVGTGTVTSVGSGAGLTGGPITLAGTLVADWHAGVVASLGSGLSLTGGLLDAVVPPQPLPSSTLPLIEGVAAVGVLATYARADHVHPALAGGTSVTISDTAPASPSSGDLWWDSVGAQLYIRYDDGSSSQWVIANTAGLGAGVTAGVVSFNTRAGTVTLTSGDVTTALTFTPYSAANPAGYQTAAQVTTALEPYAPLTSLRNTNYADNSGFSVNQRLYVSGTARTVGLFAHDRWKAGASGCTYTFTQSPGPSTTITITAGSLQQVIEGASLAGGNYVLSWIGTAQGRVGGGSYATSPVAAVGIVAGTNTTIEFNTGTLGQVRFEAGTVVTQWVPRLAENEIAACQRFFAGGLGVYITGYNVAGANIGISAPFPVQMRAVPTVAIGSSSNNNIGAVGIGAFGNSTAVFYAPITATGAGILQCTFTASADI